MCLGLLCIPCYQCYQSTFTSKALFEKSKPPYWSVSNGENLRTLTWRTYKIEGLKDVVPLKQALEALPRGTNLGAHLRPYEEGNHICYFFQPGEHTEEADAFYEKLLSIPGWGVTYSLLGDTEMIWPIIIAGHCPDDQFLFDMWSYGSDEHQVTGMRTLCGEDLLPVKMRKWRNRPFGKKVVVVLSKLKYQRKRNPWDYY